MDSDDENDASHEAIGVIFKSGREQVFRASPGAFDRLADHIGRNGFCHYGSNDGLLLNISAVAALYRAEPVTAPDRGAIGTMAPENPTPAQIERARRYLGLGADGWIDARIGPAGELFARSQLRDYQLIPGDAHSDEGDQG